MAVLSKIRERSLLLILVIGFCLLAFIVGDIIRNGGFGVTKNVGSVNGEDIPSQEFLQKVQNMERNQPGSGSMAFNSVWNQEVESILYKEKTDKAGLRAGREHVLDVYAQQFAGNPQFLNAFGKFDKAKFNTYLQEMKSTNPEMYRAIESNRPAVEDYAKRQFYVALLQGGVYTTKAEAKAKYEMENDKVSFDYVYVPYTTVNDEEVKVSDDEIVAYMKKNEKKYKADATRNLEYVLIENKPSTADENEIRGNINSLLSPSVEYNESTGKNDTIPSFANVSDDKIGEYVREHSDMPYDTTYVTKEQLPVDYANEIFNLQKGQVYGPYTFNGYQMLTKMVGRKPNESTKVVHVLVAYKGALRAAPSITRTKEEAKALADTYLNQTNSNPEAIKELAKTNSDDPGSAQNAGIYDVTPDGGWAEEFKDFAVKSPAGKTGVVETDFGYHVMRILEKNDAVQIATIAQKIQPSEKTVDDLFTKATKLEVDAAEGKKSFEELAKENGLTVVPVNGVTINDQNIQGLGAQRGIIRWAYDDETEEGAVKRFDVTNGHVIVKVKSINKEGLQPVDAVKLTILPILQNEKKAAIIKEKMKGESLEEVAKSTGSSVSSASSITMANPIIQGVGSEPKVVGTAFGLEDGKTSGLVDDTTGVFKVRKKSVEKAPELPNYTSYVSRMNSQNRGSVQPRLTKAMKEEADIEDNRYMFY
ncbi:peptidylprolyl isomerase [Flavobacterium rhizosphaerae]|uniref:Periplasmic chaperone PpiD n=1 Tax=Flavobacterium rhizosphaerae TaxID=3163298 RepID=A0ABW8YSA9_9FLAO